MFDTIRNKEMFLTLFDEMTFQNCIIKYQYKIHTDFYHKALFSYPQKEK